MHRPRWVLRGLVLSCALLSLAVPARRPARAEGEAPAPMEVRIHRTGALLRGTPDFVVDRGPRPVPTWDFNDEFEPLFGRERPEPSLPLGTADDLIEQIKGSVGAPFSWDAEGVAISALGGFDLVVRAPADLQREVAAYLEAQARRVLSTVTLDVAALTGDPTAARRADGLAGAVTSGALRPLGIARLILRPGAQGAARDGLIRSGLLDVDVEVAQDASISDPIVAAWPEGIGAQARVALVRGRIAARVRAWWTAGAGQTTYRTKQGDMLELPAVDGRQLDATLDLADGVWSFVPGAGGVVWAVRGTVSALGGATEAPTGPAVLGPASLPPFEPARLDSRSFDVSEFAALRRDTIGTRMFVAPSTYVPPAPPETPEPFAILPTDGLVELVRAAIDPRSWETEGVSLELRGPRLLARTDPARREAVEGLLGALRRDRLQRLRVGLEVIALPLASLPEWWSGLREGPSLEALLSRAGARRVEAAEVALLDGGRDVSLGGRRRTYLADYDVEIAESSTIANPITLHLLEGTSFDVAAERVLGSQAVAITLRLDRGEVLEMRPAHTSHGPLECPVYAILRAQGACTVPLGGSRVVAASAGGREVTLAILSVRADEGR